MARLRAARQVQPAAGRTEVLGETERGIPASPTNTHPEPPPPTKGEQQASFVWLPLFGGGGGEATENWGEKETKINMKMRTKWPGRTKSITHRRGGAVCRERLPDGHGGARPADRPPKVGGTHLCSLLNTGREELTRGARSG